MNKLIVLALCLLTGVYANAAVLGDTDRKIIESAGIQVYPEAQFVNGSQVVGYRFASSQSQAAVRVWYRQQLSDWSLYQQFGGWILYNGEPGLSMGGVMSARQVMVKKNGLLHNWFGIDKDLSTEIVIMIP